MRLFNSMPRFKVILFVKYYNQDEVDVKLKFLFNFVYQIETIQISIKDDTNELVKFKSGIQKVIIKLHFRPKNSDNGV